VKDICARYDLPYNSGPLVKQLAGVQRTILRLAFPGGHPRPKPGPYRGDQVDEAASSSDRAARLRASGGCFRGRGGIASPQGAAKPAPSSSARRWRFYDDQMTQHAAALTYYGLMSLFPAALLAISLLGLIGEYPATYGRDHRLPAQGGAGICGRSAGQLAANGAAAQGHGGDHVGRVDRRRPVRHDGRLSRRRGAR